MLQLLRFPHPFPQIERLEDQLGQAYASRKLFPREVKYAVIEKECLALVWGLKFFTHLPMGTGVPSTGRSSTACLARSYEKCKC